MKQTLVALPVLAAALLLPGCSSPSATYLEPGGSRLVTDVGRINIQDFASAADSMVQSLIDNLINQNKLSSAAPAEPALMAISRIQNNTSAQLDTDLLVKKMRVALLRTGKVQTSTTEGLGGPEDPLAAEAKKRKEFFEDQKRPRRPDYTLSGKIIEDVTRAGNTRQAAFVFQLSLSSTAGIAVWEEERTIVKQGKRPAVGF